MDQHYSLIVNPQSMKALAVLALLVLVARAEIKISDSGLGMEVVEEVEGCREVARRGSTVWVHYTGTLESGAKFESSLDAGEPLQFTLGECRSAPPDLDASQGEARGAPGAPVHLAAHEVVAGWEEGLEGMCVGEVRRLVVPPHLAYGEQGYKDSVPGGATVHFQVELVQVKEEHPGNVFRQMDTNGDKMLSKREVRNHLREQQKVAIRAGGKEAKEAMKKDVEGEAKAIIDAEDKDKDGFISHAEFTGPKHEGATLDDVQTCGARNNE